MSSAHQIRISKTFRDIFQSVKANFITMPQIGPRQISSTLFPIFTNYRALYIVIEDSKCALKQT